MRTFTIVLLYSLVSLGVSLAFDTNAQDVVSDTALTLMSITAGVVIAAAGVFLGSLGSLVSAARADSRLSTEDATVFIDGLSSSAVEVRHNIVFSLFAIPVALLLEILRREVYGSGFATWWGIDVSWAQILCALTLLAVLLTLEAARDSIRVMFAVYDMLKEFAPASNANSDGSGSTDVAPLHPTETSPGGADRPADGPPSNEDSPGAD